MNHQLVKPSCFIIMPFGKKQDAKGNVFDFDEIYKKLIQPAVEAADMQAIRADEENVDGIIHKPMYERLILSDYAIADLTTANANVFYELGVRHSVKPFTTISLFATGSVLPFDVNFLRGMPYGYDTEKKLTSAAADIEGLKMKLVNAKKDKKTDSPLYQLVDGIHFQNSVAHEKTDIFRDKVMYDESLKRQLHTIRSAKSSNAEKLNQLHSLIESNKPLENLEAGVLIDIMLTFRSLEYFEEMINFIRQLPVHVQQTIMVQEQWAFALNRLKTPEARAEAIQILENVIAKNGPASETYGILGRIYKDMFLDAINNNNHLVADAYLDKALETYLNGLYADWRDAYPGVNALMLLELKGENEKIRRLAPVVEFSVERKMDRMKPDYWDFASLLEIAIIENNYEKAKKLLGNLITTGYEDWMIDTTLNNFNLISAYRKKRNQEPNIIEDFINQLTTLKKQ